tara:strand:- start:7894 stop:8460 length:567 start_codon:yes stop_codon:yes gene_type:complete
MKFLKSLNSLRIEGSDAYMFIDSLVSNSINENEHKFSYLLGPDGKVNFWFIFTRQNDLLKIYQSESNLIELKKVLEKYKIRTKCELNIVKEDKFFEIVEKDDFLGVKVIHEPAQHADWYQIEMAYELPSLKIIRLGLLPNEIKWLENFVDFDKGCFIGQEQASRIKFRGNPRRILKTLPNSTQEIVKK